MHKFVIINRIIPILICTLVAIFFIMPAQSVQAATVNVVVDFSGGNYVPCTNSLIGSPYLSGNQTASVPPYRVVGKCEMWLNHFVEITVIQGAATAFSFDNLLYATPGTYELDVTINGTETHTITTTGNWVYPGTQNIGTVRFSVPMGGAQIDNLSFSIDTEATPGDAANNGTSKTVDNPDPDGDGISGSRDNCPYDYNPDQEDGWGSAMGDLCDTDWYNRTGQGVSGFVQKSGMFHLHGNCVYLADGAPRCPVIATFDPLTFDLAAMPTEIGSDNTGTWSVWLHYLHSNDGADVYQVNVYSTNPPQPDTLIDDQLEIHVNGESWQWYRRGGDTRYHGN